MASNKRSGYVQNVTPAKTNKYGSTYFDLSLQTESEEPINVKVYGDENYRRALTFKDNMSPVKMIAPWSDDYNAYLLPERNHMEQASTTEVPYPFSPDKVQSSPASVSMGSSTRKINELKNSSDFKTYFTVCGRFILGYEEPNTLPFGTVKDDVAVIDETGYIIIKIWNEMIGRIANGSYYSITRCKVRRISGQTVLTGSPSSELSLLDDYVPPLDVPDVNMFQTQSKLNISCFSNMGEPRRSKQCSNCKYPLDCAGVQAKKCEKCKRFINVRNLPFVITVPVFIQTQQGEIQLLMHDDILHSFGLKCADEDEKIAMVLLQVSNVVVHFHIPTKKILKIVDEQEISDEDISNLLTDEETPTIAESDAVKMPPQGALVATAQVTTPTTTEPLLGDLTEEETPTIAESDAVKMPPQGALVATAQVTTPSATEPLLGDLTDEETPTIAESDAVKMPPEGALVATAQVTTPSATDPLLGDGAPVVPTPPSVQVATPTANEPVIGESGVLEETAREEAQLETTPKKPKFQCGD